MVSQELSATAKALIVDDKGLPAMDESNPIATNDLLR